MDYMKLVIMGSGGTTTKMIGSNLLQGVGKTSLDVRFQRGYWTNGVYGTIKNWVSVFDNQRSHHRRILSQNGINRW